MQTITKSFLFSFVLVLSPQAFPKDNFTFGIGAGTFYSGVGVNAGIQSKSELKYISAGCVSYSSLYDGTCGVGIG